MSFISMEVFRAIRFWLMEPPPGKIQYVSPPMPKSIGEVIFKGFVEAVYILLGKGYGISGIKLLLVTIDTMAFLKTGQGNSGKDFKAWLTSYVDLDSMGINPDELWEHRSGLLHMTHFHSKAVHEGKVRFLIPSFGPSSSFGFGVEAMKLKVDPEYGNNYAAYSIEGLVRAVVVGINKFIAEVESDPKLKALVVSNLGEVVPDLPMAAFRTK